MADGAPGATAAKDIGNLLFTTQATSVSVAAMMGGSQSGKTNRCSSSKLDADNGIDQNLSCSAPPGVVLQVSVVTVSTVTEAKWQPVGAKATRCFIEIGDKEGGGLQAQERMMKGWRGRSLTCPDA